MQDFDWNDVRFVLAVSRSGRLSRAARQLDVDETTVARRLARLELTLGSQLFERVNGRLLITDMGQIVLKEAELIESSIERIGHAATGADAKAAGVVRLTTVPMLLNRLLVPALPRLLQAHPQLQLQLVAEPRNLSLVQREADIALRFGRPDDGQSIIARRVVDLVYGVYGPSPANAQTLPWITFENSFSSLPHTRWIAKAIKDDPETAATIFVNDSDVIVHAIRAGLGRSLLPVCIGDREPGLTRIVDSAPELTRELWLMVHPDLRHLARMAVVVAWIDQVLAEYTRPSTA